MGLWMGILKGYFIRVLNKNFDGNFNGIFDKKFDLNFYGNLDVNL